MRWRHVVPFLSILIVTAGTAVSQERPVQFQSIRFFEAGNEDRPSENPQYATQFTNSSTRFVAWEVELQNFLAGIRDQQVVAQYNVYASDGTLLGTKESDVTVGSQWTTGKVYGRWGDPEPGWWEPGSYRVEVRIGGEKVGEGSFTIVE